MLPRYWLYPAIVIDEGVGEASGQLVEDPGLGGAAFLSWLGERVGAFSWCVLQIYHAGNVSVSGRHAGAIAWVPHALGCRPWCLALVVAG